MNYLGDPLTDFYQRDDEEIESLKSIPVCDTCGKPATQEDYYYLINCKVYCEDCMNSEFRKWVDD